MRRRTFIASAAFATVSPGSAAPAFAVREPRPYAGADGGWLVFAVGTVNGFGMDFGFPYHRLAGADSATAPLWRGAIQPRLGGAIYLKIKDPDFEGAETGHVVARRVPAGSYVIDNFSFGGTVPGVGGLSWSTARPFAIPFAIRPGRATYIGSYMRSVSLGTPLEPQLGAAGFFVIADRSGRDAPFARGRLPAETPLDIEVTDVDAFGSVILRTSTP